MRIAVAREADPGEDRVAATPDTVKKLKALSAEVAVEPGAGVKSGIPDNDFAAAGATVAASAVKDADVVLKVRRPSAAELAGVKKGALVIAIMDPYGNQAETAGGYAKEMSKEYQLKQAALIAEHIKKQDIVITTALIPGRPAPRLVSKEMVASMRPGSVIVDLGVERGGNCELAKAGAVVVTGGVK